MGPRRRPALEDDELGEEAAAAYRQLVGETLALDPSGRAEETLWSRLVDDIDAMSDARQSRLSAALVDPPVFLYVLPVGFLIIAMVIIGMAAGSAVWLRHVNRSWQS